ncbi:hypothetical protein R3P38DRAFT_3049490 [Favolaschia claudopus]|uniref:F-box domain-containing protein n=1 Tax=Favolaschia claudopus TaxID=2862362 RepID=A0AAW0A620_9AGAR
MLIDASAADQFKASPFAEYLHTNYVPTDAEIEKILSHLLLHEAELAHLEARIQDLTEKRDRVKSYVESHRALISNPRRMPQDVLEGIFLQCLPTQRNPIMSASEAPMLLGQICSGWRSIAFGMPKLWASLHISLAFVAFKEGRKAAMLDWLERSAPLPLNLSVVFTPNIPDSRHAFSSILGLSARWGTLRTSNMSHADFEAMAHLDAPLVEHVQAAYQNVYDWSDVDMDGDFNADGLDADTGAVILSAPLFCQMKTARVEFSLRDLSVLVPTTAFSWNHLQHLTLKRIPERRFLPDDPLSRGLLATATIRLLQGCKNLRSVSVALSLEDPNEAWVGEKLLLPYLESLIFIIETMTHSNEASLESTDLANLITHLIMPQLHSFQLPGPSILGVSLGLPVISHLATHSPGLRDLWIPLAETASQTSLQTLRLFPHLTRLTLDLNSDTDPELAESNAPLVMALAPDEDTPDPYPALTALHIHCRVDDKVWVKLAELQVEYKTKLQNLGIWNSIENPQVVPDIHRFRAHGLIVSVEYTFSLRKALPSDGLYNYTV